MPGGPTSKGSMAAPDLLRVFVYAPMPSEFALQGDTFQDHEGRVLYVVDLPIAYDPSLETRE